MKISIAILFVLVSLLLASVFVVRADDNFEEDFEVDEQGQ